jgi:hypothetical protein
MSTHSKAEIAKYLEELRSSGVCNMFGAGEYLEAEFGMTRKEAKVALREWMASY